MKSVCQLVLIILLISLPEFIHCDLCRKRGPSTFISCDSCCGPSDDEHCCEDVTTTTAAPEKEPDWWIVGVCGGISFILVLVFTFVLLVCTKKKMQRRMLESRQTSVLQVQGFHESSFTAAPARPPPYTREPPIDRPPSYRSQRSARRSARYSSRNQGNGLVASAPVDTCILPTGRQPESVRPPEYTTMYTSETEIPTSQINAQNSSLSIGNRNDRRAAPSQEPAMSPPPAYSRHAYL